MTTPSIQLFCVLFIFVIISSASCSNRDKRSSEEKYSSVEQPDVEKDSDSDSDSDSNSNSDNDNDEKDKKVELRKRDIDDILARDSDADFEVRRKRAAKSACPKNCKHAFKPYCGYASKCEFDCEKRKDPNGVLCLELSSQ